MTGAQRGSAGRRVFTGHVFHITGADVVDAADENLVSLPDGAVAVDADGRIEWIGPASDLPTSFADAPVTTAAYILPGFVDTHVHLPQTYSQYAYGGGQLLEWLEHCIFPAEARLRGDEFAARIAADFTRRRIESGTTAAMVFGSAFPHAQDALFEESLRVGLRTVSGRGIQVVGPPTAEALLTDEATAITLSHEEVEKWHGADVADRPAHEALLQVALVPRFSLSVTPHTLEALGELYDDVKRRGVFFHSHLSENDRPGDGEIAAVKTAFGVDHYLDTYDGSFLPGSRRGGHSLLGRRSIFAHAVHCHDDELRRLAETGSSISHCPSSQLFLGSGTMPWRRTTGAGVNVAMGTDVGAGDAWSIPQVLAASYGVHISEPGDAAVALGPAELLFSATLAGARALDQEHLFGNLDPGKEADLVLVDPQRVPAYADLLDLGVRSDDEDFAVRQLLFAVLLGLRPPAISEVVVRGRTVAA